MRQTRQKQMLNDLLFEKPCHITAESLYAMVNKQAKTVSLATIYRHLDTLVKQGKLKKLLVKGTYIYDSNLDKHYHFVCENCHEVHDIKLDDHKMIESFNQDYNHSLSDIDIIFKGICNNCKKEKNNGIKRFKN